MNLSDMPFTGNCPVQYGLFGEDTIYANDEEIRIEWKDNEEKERFVLRLIGALIEESLERIPEMDEEERAETLAWIFVIGNRAVVPFEWACRLYGLNPEVIRGEIAERYADEVRALSEFSLH